MNTKNKVSLTMVRSLPAYRWYLVSSTALLLAALAMASPALAFNPNEEAAPVSSTVKRLPDPMLVSSGTAAPLYASGTAKPVGYISPLAPIQMPNKPLYPERIGSMPATVVAPTPVIISSPMAVPARTPALPPVDPAVAAHAQAIMAAEQTPISQPVQIAQPLAAPASGFVAPAPVFAVAPTPTSPPTVATPVVIRAPAVVVAAPTVPMAPPVMAQAPMPITPAPTAELSDATRTILSHVPAAIDTQKIKTGAITMNRVDPEINTLLGQKAQEDSFEAVGLSIKVRRPGLDTGYELNRAYTALMGGDTQTAIETYKNILGVEPRNEEALFGLAATYHRLGLIDQARPFYGMLLTVNPNHREGLNNFLVLVSDESPQDALPELERLETRNPDFSPIPAQLAIVLDKMGYADASREKMLRAIELSPDNMSYKYNLAVMLDRRGEYVNAVALYRSLIRASLQGANVPASLEAMQKRLNYLVTELTSARTAMGN